MSKHQPLSASSNFTFIGSLYCEMAVIGQCVSTPLCTHKHTHTHISTFDHTVCFTCPTLSCLAGIISSSSAKGSKVTPAWQPEFHVLPLFCGCVSVSCQRDSVTSLIKLDLLESCFIYIYNMIYTAFICSTVFSLLLCLPAPPILLVSCEHPCSSLSFDSPTPTSHGALTFCISPSLCPLGTD